MAQPQKPVGRSRTETPQSGKTLELENPEDKDYLCEHICMCDRGAQLTDKVGRVLKQRCTTVHIWEDEERNQLVWRYKAEVGYNMKTNPPAPLMSKDQPNRPSRFPLGRAVGDGLLKRDLEGKFQKGLLRIPDVVILKSTGEELAVMRASGVINWSVLMPVRRNIDRVVEIKFENDTLRRDQQRAYERIGGAENFRLLECTECACDTRKPREKKSPVRTPITTPLPIPPPLKRKDDDDEDKKNWPWPPGAAAKKPTGVPPAVPVQPKFGVQASPNDSVALSRWLKGAVVVGGIILVGTIALAAAPVEAVAVGLVVVVGGVAAAGRSPSDAKGKDKA